MSTDTGKQTILVVDDTPANIDVLARTLARDYTVKAALNGEKALRICVQCSKPDMVLLDIMMPDMDGYEVCRRLKDNPTTKHIPVIFITSMDDIEDERAGLELGAVDYITKPIKPAIVEIRVRTQLALYNLERELERKVQLPTEELNASRLEVIRQLGRAAEFKDNETGLHVIRMSHYARLIAQALSNNDSWSDLILNAAPMHDIGKIGIPDSIIRKPGPLTESEWKIMRKHPAFGAKIIGQHDSPVLNMAAEIALCHHEKWDGTGYPRKLKGEQIPLIGRIIAIADVFDALTTKRPYKEAWDIKDAIQWIDNRAGKHFDPGLIPMFHRVMPEILEIRQRYAEPDSPAYPLPSSTPCT